MRGRELSHTGVFLFFDQSLCCSEVRFGGGAEEAYSEKAGGLNACQKLYRPTEVRWNVQRYLMCWRNFDSDSHRCINN